MQALLALAIILSSRQDHPVFLEFIAPTPDRWIQGATTLKALHGHVVLLDYFAYTCNNCIRTHPYLKEWYRRYHKDGLEIIGIHTPEFEFEKNPANVRAAVKRFGFTWPILNDPKRENWWEEGVFGWPTKIILDPHGHRVLFRVGEGNYGLFEKVIQDEIRTIHPGIKLPPLMMPVRATDKPGAICRPVTPEIYTWIKGIPKHRVVFGAADIGHSALYSYPAVRQDGVVYLSGQWTPAKHYLIPLSSGSSLKLKYMAKEVNAVLTADHPIEIEVLQDGKPVARNDLGDDVKVVDGHTILTANGSRMFSILRNHQWSQREMELKVKNPGLQIYSFSFSTECMPAKR